MIRRGILLTLGVVGSVAVSAMLFFSSQSILASASAHRSAAPLRLETSLPLPITVVGTDITVQSLMAYEGPFLEDGSDREVVDVAALLICNTGEEMLLRAEITLICGDKTYCFFGEQILPGIPHLLLESGGAPYSKAAITDCSGWQITTNTRDYLNHGVTVAEEGMGSLKVTNQTQSTLHTVTLFYRCWLSPPDFYIGGIAYRLTVPTLSPGETVTVNPSHYAKGYSKLICVKVDYE